MSKSRTAALARPARAASAAVCLVLLAAALLWVPAPAHAAAVTVVDVTQYGARGDGVTLDTLAIQNALNAGPAPRRVVFPAGTYVFSTVWVSSDTDIVFEPGAKALTPLGSTTNQSMFAVYGTATNHVRNVSITGGTFTARPTVCGAIVARYADGLRVSNVNTIDCWRLLRTEWCDRVTATACTVTKAWAGFDIEHSTNVGIVGCTIRTMHRDGILFYASRFVTASGNTVDNYMLDAQPEGVGGIHMYGSTDGTITGNTVTHGNNNSGGIRFRDAERFWCADNYVESPGSSGLQVHRCGDFPPLNGGDGTFFHNTIVAAKLAGVDVANPLCRAVRVIDNTILTKNSSGAVVATGGVVVVPVGSVVIGNTIGSTKGCGIIAMTGNQLVAWNTLRDPMLVNVGPNTGIYARGLGDVVVGNEVVDTLRHMRSGVMVYSASSALVARNVLVGYTWRSADVRGALLSSVAGDVTPPVLTSAVPVVSAGTTPTVTFRAADTQSAIVAMRVWVDGRPAGVTPGSVASVAVPAAGAHTVECEAIDRAGNSGTTTARVGGAVASLASVAITPTAAVPYGRVVTLGGRLTDESGRPLAGQRLDLQRWDATWLRWVSAWTSATVLPDGSWTLATAAASNVRLRARFAGTFSLYAAATPAFDVRVVSLISRPAGPLLAVRGKWYTYSGTLGPRHAAGTAPIVLQFFRYESGRWVLRTSAAAKVVDITGGSRYSVPVALNLAGSWKVRAVHPETCHAATSTSFRAFTVR